jgi:hypothetical protein
MIMRISVMLIPVLAAMASCSTLGQLTVKEYASKSGERVLVGQAEPKAEYACQKLSQESQEWGLSGNLNRADAMTRLTAAAVDGASAKGANYAYVIVPSESKLGGFNMNAFKDAQVAYYKCASPPLANG